MAVQWRVERVVGDFLTDLVRHAETGITTSQSEVWTSVQAMDRAIGATMVASGHEHCLGRDKYQDGDGVVRLHVVRAHVT